jgi:hypothetical protein
MVLNGVVALIEAENTTYGQLAEVTCNKGYNSTSGTIKCLETGKWETPQCELLSKYLLILMKRIDALMPLIFRIFICL